MSTLLNLFGRSPFSPLQAHMEIVGQCVHKLPLLFKALLAKDFELLQQIAKEISELEHQADLVKNDIRNHLPKGLFLPINHSSILEILSIQDSIADHVEDIAVLLNLKQISMVEAFKSDFFLFLNKNIEAFDGVNAVIRELHELLEFSFGGVEAERVKGLIDYVAFNEHEVDLIQRKLLKKLFENETDMSFGSFYLWQKIFESLGALSNLSEKLGFRVRMILELKT